jgi:hypothetical protein
VNDADLAALLLVVARSIELRGTVEGAGLCRQAAQRLLELSAALADRGGDVASGERCLRCGVAIQQKATGRHRKWCSDKCRRAAEKEKLATPRWIGSVGYHTTHTRRLNGKASDHTCSFCGEPARDWAFNHDTPPEFVRTDPKTGHPGHPFSSRGEQDYLPLCRRCHLRYDRGAEKGGNGFMVS